MNASPPRNAWQLFVDTGGTFTDCVGVDPMGGTHRAKVLSDGTLRAIARIRDKGLILEQHWGFRRDLLAGGTLRNLDRGASTPIESFDPAEGRIMLSNPAEYQDGDRVEVDFGLEAPVVAARILTQSPLSAPLPPMRVRLATTRGTNALLEHKGAAVLLLVTEGFADLLAIGNQARHDLFAVGIQKPPPHYTTVVEVCERLDARGNVLRPLNEDRLLAALDALPEPPSAVAVAFLHSNVDSSHERRVGEILRARGFRDISLSSELSGAMGILPRAQTAVVDATLAPIIRGYLDAVRAGMGHRSLQALHVMTSAGNMQRAATYRAKDSLLSGPAGGVVGATNAARAAGLGRVLAFDMGGTSTDVSRWDGQLSYRFEHEVAGARVLAPSLSIETVAAGGGSICSFDGYRLRVGPESAGARPGPACYGAGGPLTITDVNLLLGRLDPERFGIPISVNDSKTRLEQLLTSLPEAMERDDVLAGFLAIANERMAEALTRVSVREGYRPADYALVSFGGAGGQHACALAQLLGMRTVLIPADASLLSACGLQRARIERFAEREIRRPHREIAPHLESMLEEMALATRDILVREEQVEAADLEVSRRILHLRLMGQESSLAVDLPVGADAEALFFGRYRQVYGYDPGHLPLELLSARIVLSTRSGGETATVLPDAERPGSPVPLRHQHCHDGTAWSHVPVHEEMTLEPGHRIHGPALWYSEMTSAIIPAGWSALVLKDRGLLVTA